MCDVGDVVLCVMSCRLLAFIYNGRGLLALRRASVILRFI